MRTWWFSWDPRERTKEESIQRAVDELDNAQHGRGKRYRFVRMEVEEAPGMDGVVVYCGAFAEIEEEEKPIDYEALENLE